MIAGQLTAGNTGGRFNSVESFLKGKCDPELVFNPVNIERFTGGFLQHVRLPWTASDFCYYDPDSHLLVLMSGAVYNVTDLQGVEAGSGTAAMPELIASLFMNEGPGFVSRLIGDFVIFICLTHKSEAYLFRDHVGIRPAAWSVKENTLFFSSDICRLSAVHGDGRVPDDEYLSGYFRYGDRRRTPNPEVGRLLPGHYLHFRDGVTELTRYWNPGSFRTKKELTYVQVLADLGEILRDAVRIRCDRRFTAGAHVSSGIDSGLVAALARSGYGEQEFFPGYSWSPAVASGEVSGRDERETVRDVCYMAGIGHRFTDFGPEDLVDYVSSLYGNPDLFYEGKILSGALDDGVNLLFSGWGGDEFISLADRGIDQDLLRGMHLRTFFRKNSLRHFRWFITNQFRFVVFPALGIIEGAVRRSFSDDARYLKKGYKKSDRGAVATFYFHTSRRQVHLNMLRFYHLQKRCEDWMTDGYRRGVEYRYPLLDRRIIEYMLTVPTVVLYRPNGPRALVRDLSEGLLPESVRENYSKTDPVLLAHTYRVHEEAALRLIDEVAEWKSSGALKFIDFALLEKDIDHYRAGSGGTVDRILFRGMLRIKAVYEFVRRYTECA